MSKQSNDDAQVHRFRETARALGCDEDKDKFESTLGKIVNRAKKYNEAVLGYSESLGPLPDELREIMDENSRALHEITKKSLC
jgi:hypothetical protein